jgi:hypothetical protein
MKIKINEIKIKYLNILFHLYISICSKNYIDIIIFYLI